MRKTCLALVVLAVLVSPYLAQAGERAGAFSISPFVGGYMYDEDHQKFLMRNRPVYGLRLGYDWTDHFGTEAVVDWVRAEYRGVDEHLGAWSYRLDLLYNFMPRAALVPYVAAGGGGETINYYRRDGGTSTDATANAGGGFKLFFTDSAALRGDARYIWDFRGDDRRPNRNIEYSLGLSFLFGGAKAAAEEVVTGEAPLQPPTPAQAPAEQVPAAEPTPGHYKYCMTLHVEFDIDRALVRPQYRDEIARVGDFMKKYPTTTAVIQGHTDNVGPAEHNMELSQRRAEAVVSYLVEDFGIDRSRLSAKGYGFTRPIADNATDEGRQKNRRIEAVIDCAFDVRQITPPDRLCMTLVMDFDTGKADITPEYREEIAKVAEYMKRNPTTTAIIEGHTDNVGDYDVNMKLSQQRAENVVNHLVENFGIDRSRLSAKGYGYSRRIAYDDTPEGRAKNRRINAVIDCVIKRPVR